MAEDRKEQRKKMAQVIAKAWSDESFKEGLLSDPRAVLGAHGITLPEGIAVRAVENTDRVFHFVIPAKPPDVDVALAEERAAADCICFCFCDPDFCICV